MINEELMSSPVVTLAVPKGENVENFIENYFGTVPTSSQDMPTDEDVDATVLIKLA